MTSAWTLRPVSPSASFQRPVGNSEYAFIPSSLKDGLGDMFLHLAFRAPKSRMGTQRITLAWAILRLKHPLLMAKISQDQAHGYLFDFLPPKTSAEAIASAAGALVFTTNQTREELMLGYMNGPRSLKDDNLSCLTICTHADSSGDYAEYELMMCAPHFIGDGTSLHQATHELLEILAASSTDDDLIKLVEEECSGEWLDKLPPSVEDRLPIRNRWKDAVANVNFQQTLYKEIGGHSFSRTSGNAFKTILLERSYTASQTSDILKRCKSKGVTINHAVFGVCDIAWAKVMEKRRRADRKTLPLMMYSAINLRSYLTPHPSATPWFIALTYFNVIMPSFFPAGSENDVDLKHKVFWHRCANVKSQIRCATQSQFLLGRAKEMGARRALRAGSTSPSLRRETVTLEVGKKEGCREDAVLAPAPSAALLGLSLIGNLDGVYRGPYQVAGLDEGFTLHTVTTASRLKPGGLLLLSHTFRGRLWFQLFFDVNGFEKNGAGKTEVEEFWEEIGSAVTEFLE